MNSPEIIAAAAAIGNQLKAGIPVASATSRLPRLQPRYAEFWTSATEAVRNGKPLSESLATVWPDDLVQAVKAGEIGGKIDDVMDGIVATTQTKIDTQRTLSKLIYPVGMGMGGLLVFLGFMYFVLPPLGKALTVKKKNIFFEFSDWFVALINNNGTLLAVGLAAAIFALVAWLRTAEARNTIISVALQLPVMGDALSGLFFGQWARGMALLAAAGIPTIQALHTSAAILPQTLGDSVRAFAADLQANKSLSEAADVDSLPEDDTRKRWPFYIANAFVVADQTGTIDNELLRASPLMIHEGTTGINRVVSVLNVVAMAVSAGLIVSPMAGYYLTIFSAMQGIGQ